MDGDDRVGEALFTLFDDSMFFLEDWVWGRRGWSEDVLNLGAHTGPGLPQACYGRYDLARADKGQREKVRVRVCF
jgi:hypothetical protein